jgi:transposase
MGAKETPCKTPQECSRCGQIKKSNWRGRYICSCGYQGNVDTNASFNISKRPAIAPDGKTAA